MTAAPESTEPKPTLLTHIRSLVEAEAGLTSALSQTHPLLNRSNHSSVLSSQSAPPLLPTPQSSDEVATILAVARAYSLRTSAPPMWNPNLPVVGFATPNPLPHQLRGGALGGMQLQLAKEAKIRKNKELVERREKERRDKLEAEEAKVKAEIDEMEVDEEHEAGEKRKREEPAKATSAKKNEMLERQRRQLANVPSGNGEKNKVVTSMNLSDSSSEEESDDN